MPALPRNKFHHVRCAFFDPVPFNVIGVIAVGEVIPGLVAVILACRYTAGARGDNRKGIVPI